MDSSWRGSKEASNWQHWICTNEVRSHSQRKRLLGPPCSPVCPSVCPSFCIYHCNSLWKDFCEMLTQGTFMEIWRETANHFIKSGWKYQGSLHGDRSTFNCYRWHKFANKELLCNTRDFGNVKKSDSTQRQHNYLFYRGSSSANGPHSCVIPVSYITFIIGLIELRKIK